MKRPGVYGDRHGLRLRVYKSSKRGLVSKQWIWRGTVGGKRRDIGLGGFPYVTLAEARQTAFEYRKISRAGGDPVTLRRRPDVPTFAQAAETVIGIHREGWKDGGKSEMQWRASLRDYVMPRLGRKGVDEITTADVMAVLIPHWHSRNETMRRVRQRIGAMMKWAVAQGHRGDNPAGDAIAAALPKNGTGRRHLRALPFREVGAALARVRSSGAYRPAVLAFEFLVLTACRSGEVRFATWDEIDLEAATWTIPASRMKAGREHRVRYPGARWMFCGRRVHWRTAPGWSFRRSAPARSMAARSPSSCGSSGSTPCRTGSGRPFGTGRRNAPMPLARSASSPWRT